MKFVNTYVKAFILFLALATLGWTYIPPSHFLVRTMTQKKSALKNLKSDWVWVRGEPPQDRVTSQLLYDSLQRRWKMVFKNDQGELLYGIGSESNPPVGPVFRLLLDTSAQTTIEALQRAGFKLPEEGVLGPTDPLRLDRQGTQVSWVIGDGPELWIEKDRFLATFWRNQAGTQNITFLGFRFQREFPFPKSLELREGSDRSAPVKVKIEIQSLQTQLDSKDFQRQFQGLHLPENRSLPSWLEEVLPWIL
jgi:hypothetical protein